MTWGGVAKPPVVPRGVEVAPHPWNCSRGIMFVINSQNMAKIPVDLELIGRGLKKGVVRSQSNAKIASLEESEIREEKIGQN